MLLSLLVALACVAAGCFAQRQALVTEGRVCQAAPGIYAGSTVHVGWWDFTVANWGFVIDEVDVPVPDGVQLLDVLFRRGNSVGFGIDEELDEGYPPLRSVRWTDDGTSQGLTIVYAFRVEADGDYDFPLGTLVARWDDGAKDTITVNQTVSFRGEGETCQDF